MTTNWKKLTALIMTVIMMLSMLPASLGEYELGDSVATMSDLPENPQQEEIMPEVPDASPEGDAEGSAPEDDASGMIPEDPETEEETPAEEDVPEVEAEISEIPELKSLKLSVPTAVVGEGLTVTVQVQHVEKVLLLVDGAPYPTLDTEGMTGDEVEAALQAAAFSVPEDGIVKLNMAAPAAAGVYSVSVRLWAQGAWHDAGATASLKVVEARAAGPQVIMQNDEIIGNTVYIGLYELGAYSGTSDITKIKLSSTRIVSVEFVGSANFIVLPKKTGSVKLTIYWAGGGTTAYTFIVLPNMDTAAGITMHTVNTRLELGSSLQLSYSLVPSTANSGVTFKSSSNKVASVSASGVVTGLKEGTATITATTWNGKTAKVTVTVFDPKKPTSVVFPQGKTGILLLGETLHLNPVMVPATAESAFTWSSSNKKVATVDAYGQVTPLKEGSTVITVKTWNKKSARITLKVVDPYKPTSLSIKVNGSAAAAGTTQWASNQPLRLSYNAVSYGGSSYPVPSSYLTWSSSSSKIASIDADGEVTIKKASTVTFTLKGIGGAKATVKFKFILTNDLTKITVSPASVTLKPGETRKMTAALIPSNSAPLVNLEWSSSNTAVATVNASGTVTAVRDGTAVIYAQDVNTGIYGASSVVVSSPAVYRAVVAVEPTYLTVDGYTVKSTRQSDLDMISKVLSQQNYQGARWSVTKLHSTSKSRVLSALSTVAGQANEHDVTMFFFMGHGSSDGSIHFFNGDYITPSVLKSYLDQIPGKVVVMLGSCYSGEYVAKGTGSAFNSAIISTFGKGETIPVTLKDENGQVIPVTEEMLTDTNAEAGMEHTPKRGELRASKYYVLTAAAAGQTGWSTFTYNYDNYGRPVIYEPGSYTYFVRGVSRAGGWDGIDQKTLWSSGTRTLSQVYSSVYSYCINQGGSSSNVQVYPSGSDFVIFSK